LLGVEPDVTVEDGEIFGGRLQLIHTPGHDSDTVCWFDIPTGTLISGDSLQANGTTTQGIGLYMDLPGYVSSLARLSSMEIENIIAGHPYLPCGSVAKGKKQVAEYLNICTELVGFYNNFIRDELKSGEHDAVVIARRLIEKVGGIIPEYMFLPLYTVTEHLKAIS
jgi:hypothetical protein